MQILVAESLSDRDDRLDCRADLARCEAVAAEFIGSIDAHGAPLGVEAEGAGMVLAER